MIHWIILIISPIASILQITALWSVPVWAVPFYALFFVINYYNFFEALENIKGINFYGPKHPMLTLMAWRHTHDEESEEP